MLLCMTMRYCMFIHECVKLSIEFTYCFFAYMLHDKCELKWKRKNIENRKKEQKIREGICCRKGEGKTMEKVFSGMFSFLIMVETHFDMNCLVFVKLKV